MKGVISMMRVRFSTGLLVEYPTAVGYGGTSDDGSVMLIDHNNRAVAIVLGGPAIVENGNEDIDPPRMISGGVCTR